MTRPRETIRGGLQRTSSRWTCAARKRIVVGTRIRVTAGSFNAGLHIVNAILGRSCDPELHPAKLFAPARFTDAGVYGPPLSGPRRLERVTSAA